jgi:hypothetical protein
MRLRQRGKMKMTSHLDVCGRRCSDYHERVHSNWISVIAYLGSSCVHVYIGQLAQQDYKVCLQLDLQVARLKALSTTKSILTESRTLARRQGILLTKSNRTKICIYSNIRNRFTLHRTRPWTSSHPKNLTLGQA